MLGLTSVALLLIPAASPSLHRLASDVARSPAECRPGGNVSLRIAATTDVHGHIRGWDGYAMLRNAPVAHDMQQDIRQLLKLLIEEVQRRHEVHEADYRTNHWSFIKPGATR